MRLDLLKFLLIWVVCLFRVSINMAHLILVFLIYHILLGSSIARLYLRSSLRLFMGNYSDTALLLNQHGWVGNLVSNRFLMKVVGFGLRMEGLLVHHVHFVLCSLWMRPFEIKALSHCLILILNTSLILSKSSKPLSIFFQFWIVLLVSDQW